MKLPKIFCVNSENFQGIPRKVTATECNFRKVVDRMCIISFCGRRSQAVFEQLIFRAPLYDSFL